MSQKYLVHGDVDKVKCWNRCRVREGPVTYEIFTNISKENKRKKKKNNYQQSPQVIPGGKSHPKGRDKNGFPVKVSKVTQAQKDN